MKWFAVVEFLHTQFSVPFEPSSFCPLRFRILLYIENRFFSIGCRRANVSLAVADAGALAFRLSLRHILQLLHRSIRNIAESVVFMEFLKVLLLLLASPVPWLTPTWTSYTVKQFLSLTLTSWKWLTFQFAENQLVPMNWFIVNCYLIIKM